MTNVQRVFLQTLKEGSTTIHDNLHRLHTVWKQRLYLKVSQKSLYLKSVPRVTVYMGVPLATNKICVSGQTDKSNNGGSDELNLPLKRSDMFNTCVLHFKDEKFQVVQKNLNPTGKRQRY